MKPLILIILSICLTFKIKGQSFSANDTIIVMDKMLAKRIIAEYKNHADINEDLVNDHSKEGIITDRPHIAETPILVPKNFIQWESGFQVQKSHSQSTNILGYTFNNLLIRPGLSRRVEGRFIINYLGTKTYNQDSSSYSSRISGITLGSKIAMFNEKGFRPKGTLLYTVTFPFGGTKYYRPPHTNVSELMFLFVNRITKFYDFEYNLGLQWDGSSQQTAYAYALNNEFAANEKFFFFAEVYGYFYEQSNSEGRFNGKFTGDHRANGGVYYRLSKDWQIDLSGGFGLSKVSPDYYVGFGLSNRFRISKPS